jgi:hypothetical protein
VKIEPIKPPAKQPQEQKIRDLIRQLQEPHYSIEVEKELVAIGKPALPFLEEAAKESNGPLPTRAIYIIRKIKQANPQ